MTQGRLLACKIALFWAETGRLDWQPANLPKGTGYALPQQGVVLPRYSHKTVYYRQNNAVE